MFIRRVTGNYELSASVAGAESTPSARTPSARTPAASAPSARIRFSGSDGSVCVYLEIDGQGFRVARQDGEVRTALKKYPGGGPPPWEIRVLKKGNFFRFGVNGKTGWIRGPSGEWDGRYDPWENELALEGTGGCEIESCTVTKLPWLDQRTEPVIARGPAGKPLREADHSGRHS